MKFRVLSLILAIVLSLGMVGMFDSCGETN